MSAVSLPTTTMPHTSEDERIVVKTDLNMHHQMYGKDSSQTKHESHEELELDSLKLYLNILEAAIKPAEKTYNSIKHSQNALSLPGAGCPLPERKIKSSDCVFKANTRPHKGRY